MGMLKTWRKLNQGWPGVIISIVFGVALAAFFYYGVLSTILQTSLPVVAVVSGSMDHGITDDNLKESAYPCGKVVDGYTESFGNWWDLCGGSYAQFGITAEQFMEFPFRDGFKKGDMPIVQKSDSYKEGDIIVYTALNCQTREISESAPIIHRIVEIDEQGIIHTKGDHNRSQNHYENCISKDQVHGRVIFIIPKLGYVKVLASETLGFK